MEATKSSLKLAPVEVDMEVVSKAVAVVVKKVDAIGIIKKEEDAMLATEMVGVINTELKRLDADRIAKVKPLKDYVAMLDSEYRERIKPLNVASIALLSSLAEYKAAEAKKVEIANAKAAVKAEKVAEKTGTEVAFVPQAMPTKSVATTKTQVTFSTVWDYEIVDEAKLPDVYVKKTPNLAMLRAAVNSGTREIAGVKIFSKQVPSIKNI